MKKFLLTLLFIIFFTCTPIFASSFPYNGDLSFATDITENYYNSYVDLLIPVYGTQNSFLFLSPRLNMSDKTFLKSSSTGNSIGIGYRKYHDNFFNIQAITGINFYYDDIKTKTGNNFQQFGTGLELFTKNFDFKINGYFPFSNTEKFLKKSFDLLEGHKIAANYYYESTLCGFDTELGIKIPIPDKFGIFHIFGGYYLFKADRLEKDLKGLKATLEYKPITILKLSYGIFENKNLQHTNWQANISLNVPFNFKKLVQTKNPLSFKNKSDFLKDRIGEQVTRDTIKVAYPVIAHRNETLKFDKENDIYFIVASVNGKGDGTFENPANISNAVEIAKSVTGNNSTLLLLGGQYDISSTINLNGFNAENVLITGKQEIEYLGADLSKITTTNPVLFSTSTTIFAVEKPTAENFAISSIEFLSNELQPESSDIKIAVEIKNAKNNFILQNNSFKNFDAAVNVAWSSSNTVIYNNIFQNNSIGVNIETLSVTIRENIFFNNIGNAINAYGANNIIVYSNLLNANYCGVNIGYSANAKILYNEFSNNDFSIVSEWVHNSYISDNLIHNTKEDAIISKGDSDSTITDNIIIENEKNGINMIQGRKNYIYNNKIINNKLNAVQASNINLCYISKNDINNNTETGIILENSNDTEISTNTVSNNKTGMSLTGGNNIYVSSNTINNSETALYAVRVSTLSVVANTISSSTVSAMHLSNMENGTVTANSVSNSNGNSGIYADNLTDFYFGNNHLSKNSGNGLNLTNSKDIILHNNMFSYTNGNGLSLTNSTGIFLLHNIFNNNNAIGGIYGLYLKNNIVFDSGSGDNIFYNSNYSGDAEAVREYEQHVKPNDNFY